MKIIHRINLNSTCIYLWVLFFFVLQSCFSQNQITIYDISDKPISFVSIFLPNQNTGFYTDAKGRFEQNRIDKLESNDSLIFQHPFYETLITTKEDVVNSQKLVLKNVNYKLDELVISNKTKLKTIESPEQEGLFKSRSLGIGSEVFLVFDKSNFDQGDVLWQIDIPLEKAFGYKKFKSELKEAIALIRLNIYKDSINTSAPILSKQLEFKNLYNINELNFEELDIGLGDYDLYIGIEFVKLVTKNKSNIPYLINFSITPNNYEGINLRTLYTRNRFDVSSIKPLKVPTKQNSMSNNPKDFIIPMNIRSRFIIRE